MPLPLEGLPPLHLFPHAHGKKIDWLGNDSVAVACRLPQRIGSQPGIQARYPRAKQSRIAQTGNDVVSFTAAIEVAFFYSLFTIRISPLIATSEPKRANPQVHFVGSGIFCSRSGSVLLIARRLNVVWLREWRKLVVFSKWLATDKGPIR